MSPYLRKLVPSIRQLSGSRSCSRPYSVFNGGLNSTQELVSLDQRWELREKRTRRGQILLPRGSAVPLSYLLHSSAYCTLHPSLCQVPFLLSHPSSLHHPQEKLLKVRLNNVPSNPNLEWTCWGFSLRGFCSASDDNSDSDRESETDNLVKSNVDPEEVSRICRVIDELFALDRNMEAVLDECGIKLTHDLLVEVLDRFRHARKPALRFFCWAGQRPGFAHDSRTYNSMINILAKSRQFETMVAMLDEMGMKGFLTVETFLIAIKAFAGAKERKKAVGMFELMKKHKFKVGADTINCLLDSLGRAKLGKEAEVLFEKLKDRFTPNLTTYTVLLNGWCRVKNLMDAGRVWNEMIDKGFKPDVVVYNVMLEGLLRCKKKSDAIKLFEVMKAKGPSPNLRSYTIMIRDFCKQGQMKEAVEYFDEMRDSGCQPDAAVYTCLITGYGNHKQMDMVYGLLKEMQEGRCPPDGHTYNSLIKLLTSRRMPDDAARIYRRMVLCGIQPTIHTYNMIMKSYFQIRKFGLGYAVWDEMRHKGLCPDDNSYTVFIGGLISESRSGEACRYLGEMLEKGMKAPHLDYNKLAVDFSRVGKPDVLEELARKMKFFGKHEVSDVLISCAERMRRGFKRRDLVRPEGQCT